MRGHDYITGLADALHFTKQMVYYTVITRVINQASPLGRMLQQDYFSFHLPIVHFRSGFVGGVRRICIITIFS